MARQVDLGDYLNVALGGVGDYFANILVCKVTSVVLVPATIAGCNGRIHTAKTSYFGKLGVRLYLHAPALVVGEMQVQMVDLVVCEI